MLLVLLILLLAVALGGVTLATLELRGRPVPLPVGALHGTAGIVLIVLLVIHVVRFPRNMPVNAATALFMLTASGGLLLFAFRAGRQRLPGLVLGLHAAFALAAISLMLVGYLHG
ncbi:MAG: hypothetical protein KGJ56_01925 [Gammaproteobacteria bacterium]|nr:hypothetical protein [Gammaproteobacteria bacterium]